MSEGISPTSYFWPSAHLFGVPLDLSASDAQELLGGLRAILTAQFLAAAGKGDLSSSLSRDSPPGAEELMVFATWFDPTAKGERIRTELSRLQTTQAGFPYSSPLLVVDAGDGRHLVTPEGWLIARCLCRAEKQARHNESAALLRRRLTISDTDAGASVSALLETYRIWTRRRIDDVVGLLTSETSTLRPAAAGLLFTLLVNRNTARDRALRRPSDPRQLAIVAQAVAAPALAYAEGLSGRRNSPRSLDLYRGWALGELRRRLGPGLHTGVDEGIWLDEKAAQEGVQRLIQDVRRRNGAASVRIPAAVAAALAAYDARRPELAGLELAFERPANTRRLAEALIQAANVGSGSQPGSVGVVSDESTT